MHKLIARIHNGATHQKGATAIEYALIAALIGVVIVGGVEALGGDIKTLMNDIGSTISGSGTSS